MRPALETGFNDVISQMMAHNAKVNPTNDTIIDPTNPFNTPPAVPTLETTASTPAPATPNAVPAAAPVVAIPPAAAPVVDFNAMVEDWDSSTTQASAQPTSPAPTTPVNSIAEINYSDIAKELSLGEIKTKDEFIRAAQELKKKANSLGELPSDLSKAVEIAKLGGNYLEYLNVSVVDWEGQDPVVLYENYVIDRYTNKEGMVDSTKVDKLLDTLSDEEKELRGRELQNQYVGIQQQQKQRIEYDARQAKANFEQGLKQAMDSVDNIAGFKLSPNHKTEIFNEILSGADLKHNDLRSRVEAAALRKYWTKMDDYRKTQIKNSTLKQTLDEATFPRLNSTSSVAAPEAAKAEPLWKSYLDELTKRRGF
jgi:hypothetical protein